MIAYYFIFSSFFSFLYCQDILSLLWEEEDMSVRRVLTGKTLSDPENSLMINRLSQLPFTVDLKSEAWYKLLKSKNVSNFKLKDWLKYESLIPYLPPSLLQNVNFSDESILIYFGTRQFNTDQLAVIAEAVKKLEGPDVLESEYHIIKMGNIFCGFPLGEIMNISTSTLRYIMNHNFFENLEGCSADRLEYLAKAIQCYKVIGPPNAWDSDTVRKVGSLLSALNSNEIRSIRDGSFSMITPEIISRTPVQILKNLRNDQLRSFSKESLVTWRRKTQDFRLIYLYGTSSIPSNNIFIVIPCMLFCIKM